MSFSKRLGETTEQLKIVSENCSPDSEIYQEMEHTTSKYRMRLNEYYINLIKDKEHILEDPIGRQCIPSREELEDHGIYTEDPLNEGQYSPVPFLIHKYPDRALIEVSNQCFMICRHCTRKNTAMSAGILTPSDFQRILDYLEKTRQIRDVLISGGDPLTLDDDTLEYYISRIRQISHIQTIRIGTRAIVTYPKRITEKLADMLEKYHPIWINTQFNHPAEITSESEKACDILTKRGIPLGNQSVLLRGVNDNIETMEALVTGLIRIRVRPYYLYLCDQVKGTEHFYVSYQKGMAIIDELQHRVSGYAVPRFIIDAPGPQGGKTIVERSHLLCENQDEIVLAGLKAGTRISMKLPKETGTRKRI